MQNLLLLALVIQTIVNECLEVSLVKFKYKYFCVNEKAHIPRHKSFLETIIKPDVRHVLIMWSKVEMERHTA